MPQSFLRFYNGDDGIPTETFTEEDKTTLDEIVTNTDGNIFCLKIGKRLNPEQAGAVLSRYSRTSLTARTLLLKEFLPNADREKEFFNTWLVGFGDDSIQQLVGGMPLACEFISNLAAKEIEDGRLAAYLEKSTRYVPFDKPLSNGEFMFYKDRAILQSKFCERYLSLMKSLFIAYAKHLQGMRKLIADANPLEKQLFNVGDRVIRLSDLDAKLSEECGITDKQLGQAYDSAIRAQALDMLRDFLPLATLTHVGISANIQEHEHIASKLASSELEESRWIGQRIKTELSKLSPSLIGGSRERYEAAAERHLSRRRTHQAILAEGLVPRKVARYSLSERKKDSCNLIYYTGRGSKDPDREANVLIGSHILYELGVVNSLKEARDRTRQLDEKDLDGLVSSEFGERENRRDKPGRPLEHIRYEFDINSNVGIYRDLQRHRIGTQQREPFTVKHGYTIRTEYTDLGIMDEYRSLMSEVVDLYNDLYRALPYQSQYAVTFGFGVGWTYEFDARQAFHLIELRTSPQGHPDYRRLVQDMHHQIKTVHPTIASNMRFANLKETKLGRLDSEIRVALKRNKSKK